MDLAQSAALVEHAVSEAVGALAAPDVRDEVLRLALAKARRPDLPKHGADVASFIEGPLRSASEEVLGEEAADAIGLELAPIARMMMADEISEVRPKTPAWGVEPLPKDRPTARPPAEQRGMDSDFPEVVIEPVSASRSSPRNVIASGRRRRAPTEPAPDAVPLILVASSDPGSLDALGHALGGTAMVDPVRDALSILETAGREASRLVVVDCAHPTVRLETMIALAAELPPEARVVLWREQDILANSLAVLGTKLPAGWVCCGADATPEDVAAVCSVLLI